MHSPSNLCLKEDKRQSKSVSLRVPKNKGNQCQKQNLVPGSPQVKLKKEIKMNKRIQRKKKKEKEIKTK